jgi:glycosyltransferase involved in cell wall biosynthesis
MRLSVVTPSFNQHEFLGETLRSVLSQGYEDLEYVVIDGGSTDGSVALIEERDAELTYWVSEPDDGLYNALNRGFAHTSGDVMGWINSSDLHYPWTLRTVAEIFSQLPEVQWIMGLPSQFGGSGGPRTIQHALFNAYDVLAGDYRWIQQESVFWRRGLWEDAGGRLDESFRLAADFDLWLRFMRRSPLYHVDTVLAGYRVHDDRLAHSGRDLYEREARALVERFAEEAPARDRVRAGLIRVAGYRQLHTHTVPRVIHKLGAWPWYSHRRIVYDFAKERWVVR